MLKRIHDKSKDSGDEVGRQLTELYSVRKTKVQKTIKHKEKAIQFKKNSG